MGKIICPKCKSKKTEPITGMTIGNPVEKTSKDFFLMRCLKCKIDFNADIKTENGKKTVNSYIAEPRYADDEKENSENND